MYQRYVPVGELHGVYYKDFGDGKHYKHLIKDKDSKGTIFYDRLHGVLFASWFGHFDPEEGILDIEDLVEEDND